MRKIICYLLIIMCCSCDKIVKKKVSSQDILQEELQSFNWNEVDVYPSFSNCDAAVSKDAKKVCFQNTITEYITSSISQENIIVSNTINETVVIEFSIDKTGIPEVMTIKGSDLLYHEIPDFDSLIFKTIDSLPKIFPATKRGQQVTTQFKLPIAIKVE